MPMESFLRSETTGELISNETLEMAAIDHNIDISETSVGSLFDLPSKKKESSVKTASRKQVKLSYTDRRRKRAGIEVKADLRFTPMEQGIEALGPDKQWIVWDNKYQENATDAMSEEEARQTSHDYNENPSQYGG